MLERMRFSILRRSRLTLVVVAIVWLPYVTVRCVAAPLEEADGPLARCPMLAVSIQHSTHAYLHGPHLDKHGAEFACAEASSDGNEIPACTCCDLTGKLRVTVQEIIGLDAGPGVVTASLFGCRLAEAWAEKLVWEPVAHCAQAPPLYLTNASFLI